jgi:hypothetical protein
MSIPQAYVALGKGGLLKVGFTKRPVERVRLLKKEFLSKGDELESFNPCEQTLGAWCVERQLITHCQNGYTRHSGFEWFINCDAPAVMALAVDLPAKYRNYKPHPPTTEAESAHWREYHAKRNAERAAREAIRKAECARRSAAWQFKRRKAERVMDAFVSFVLGAANADDTSAKAGA